MKKYDTRGMYLLCAVLFTISAAVWSIYTVVRLQTRASGDEGLVVLNGLCALIWAVGSIVWWNRYRNYDNDQ